MCLDFVASSGKPGLIVVDTTTADPDSTKKVAAALAECRIGFVDGPVSGGPKGAATATMTMVLGGSGLYKGQTGGWETDGGAGS